MTDTNNSQGIKIPEGSIALGENAIISRYTIAKATQPAIDLTNPQEIIEKIKAVVENLGYSSLTFCGVDDFTGEHLLSDGQFQVEFKLDKDPNIRGNDVLHINDYFCII